MNQSFLFETELPKPIDLPGYPAAWSPCKRYRWTLWRTWTENSKPSYAQFICLNPSTATETEDDPTVRRCVQFAKDWGHEAFVMTNLFGFRSTDPEAMKADPDPVGEDCDSWLAKIATEAAIVVAAWGCHGSHLNRAEAVRVLFNSIGKPLHYLKLNADGSAQHPLYLPKTLTPKIYKFDRAPVVSEEDGE